MKSLEAIKAENIANACNGIEGGRHDLRIQGHPNFSRIYREFATADNLDVELTCIKCGISRKWLGDPDRPIRDLLISLYSEHALVPTPDGYLSIENPVLLLDKLTEITEILAEEADV